MRISLMDYCIRNLLGLTDKNFIPDEIWLETIIENNEIVRKIKIQQTFQVAKVIEIEATVLITGVHCYNLESPLYFNFA